MSSMMEQWAMVRQRNRQASITQTALLQLTCRSSAVQRCAKHIVRTRSLILCSIFVARC